MHPPAEVETRCVLLKLKKKMNELGERLSKTANKTAVMRKNTPAENAKIQRSISMMFDCP